MNPQEQFQNRITDAVQKAAANAVHPAIIYMVLGGIQQDVLYSVRQANRAAAAPAAPDTKPQTPDPGVPPPPDNVIPLPESDSPA